MTALYEFLMYDVRKWVAFACVLLPPLLFLLMIYTEVIYKFPIGRIKELEKHATIIEEGFKLKYKDYVEDYNDIFDDEEWYVTKTKHYLKDMFVPHDIHLCASGSEWQIELFREAKRKCMTKPMCFFSSFIEDVEKRRLYAVDKAHKLEKFYNEFKNK